MITLLNSLLSVVRERGARHLERGDRSRRMSALQGGAIINVTLSTTAEGVCIPSSAKVKTTGS